MLSMARGCNVPHTFVCFFQLFCICVQCCILIPLCTRQTFLHYLLREGPMFGIGLEWVWFRNWLFRGFSVKDYRVGSFHTNICVTHYRYRDKEGWKRKKPVWHLTGSQAQQVPWVRNLDKIANVRWQRKSVLWLLVISVPGIFWTH